MSFATNHITDPFKRTFLRAQDANELQLAQRLMFGLGFKRWWTGDRTYEDRPYMSFIYVNEDCRMLMNRNEDPDYKLTWREITIYDLRQALDQLKAIRKARKKDQRRRKAEKRMLAQGWVKNTGVKPEGDIIAVLMRDGEVRTKGQWGMQVGDYSIPYSGNEDKTVEYYKLAKPETVSVQDMVQGIVEDAGMLEVRTSYVDKDGFIRWDGGECPVPHGTTIDIKMRRGGVCLHTGTSGWCWEHTGYGGDIVGYRVCPAVTPAAADPTREEEEAFAAIPAGTFVKVPEVDKPATVGDVNSDARGSGARYNAGKPNFSLIPMTLLEGEARVWAYGAKKYKAWNWMKGMDWSVPFACAMRHMAAFQRGEDIDPETGESHLDHAMCNLRMLRYYADFYKEGDDRPKQFFELPKDAG